MGAEMGDGLHASGPWTTVLLRAAEGVSLVGASTLALFWLQLNFATAGFLQLLIVLVVALRGGFWAATLVSLVANVCLDYFFVPPVFHLSINDPQNWVALFVFEVTAILVSRLSAKSSEQTAKAIRGRRELERLYRVSRELLLLNGETSTITQIALLVQDVFSANAVVLFDFEKNKLSSVGEPDALLDSEVRGACLLQENIRSTSPDTVIRVLHLGSHAVGSMGIRGCRVTAMTADAVANLAAIALEQAKFFEQGSRGAVEHRTDLMRRRIFENF